MPMGIEEQLCGTRLTWQMRTPCSNFVKTPKFTSRVDHASRTWTAAFWDKADLAYRSASLKRRPILEHQTHMPDRREFGLRKVKRDLLGHG